MNTLITSLIFFTQLSFNICLENESKEIFTNNSYFPYQMEGVKSSDFELVGGLIVLEAEFNGKREKFILDTGSPHFLINDQETKKGKTNYVLNGIGGSKKVFRKRKMKLDWNGINLKRKECFSVDLENISKIKEFDFAGLIGYDQVKKHEVIVDYENRKVHLIKNKHQKAFFKEFEKTEKIKFQMIGHIPVVKVKIGKRHFYFGIDTGAEMNVIDIRNKKYLPEGFIKKDSTKSVIGGNNQPLEVEANRLNELKIGKTKYKDVPFIYADLCFLSVEKGRKIDGLLGYPFLNSGTFSIDYRKNKLNKWELKTKSEYQMEIAVTKKKIKITAPLYDHK